MSPPDDLDPMALQIQAHDEYLMLVSEMTALEAAGDVAGVRRLEPKVASAKRRWHLLARKSQAASRGRRSSR